MHWMWNIITSEIKSDWSMWFADETPLDIDNITTIRKKWTTYFLKTASVRKAEPFTGSFPVLGPPTAISGKVHQKCAASLNAARMILSGATTTTTVVRRPVFIAFSSNDGRSTTRLYTFLQQRRSWNDTSL
ncbi:Acetyl-CoA carboxylase 1 [Glycine max]|nr:Acetyl-CoA carboxylase 1 [Glycine max]